jgi:hypothetical protein
MSATIAVARPQQSATIKRDAQREIDVVPQALPELLHLQVLQCRLFVSTVERKVDRHPAL